MPITRKQFELEIDPKIEEWMRKIHSFLAQHKKEAFSRTELRQAMSISISSGDEGWSEWHTALGKLVEIEAVQQRVIRGIDYYAYGGELGTWL